ncbi:Origin recognition complex subunit 6 [Penicillium maclennaniae]|uniref:Origin recognition complex subunit 6 n=1 Tax=Penicillium maclennaniae TaxID=1343394 RepID=UPI002541BF8F|nr:Origin recognition complex subunit 6 [Penicillium maclennaniae]KAJ5674464.1 Origin recognition complex subunit 6 [Penicillium maclennaniae]
MNNRQVEQALGLLVPTHANDLPQDLLSLALNLVAQSRSFSSSLKPEEEAARPYACAEIACRRLSRALKLPPLLGHPPCLPRVYKKLYSYLERSLGSGAGALKRSASASGTPTRSNSAKTTPTKTVSNNPSRGLQNTPSKSTPLKRSVNVAARLGSPSNSPRKPIQSHPRDVSKSTIIPDAPAWAMTAIRTVCKTLSTPAPRTSTWSRPPISRTLPPHIFSGVSSILYLTSCMDRDEEGFDEETLEFLDPIVSITGNDAEFKDLVYAMVVAVYFIVLARRRNSASSEGNGETDGEAQKMDKKTFTEMRQTALTSLNLPTDRRHRDDVDQWIALIMEQGWAHGQEWFENIPLAGEMHGEDEEGISYRNLDEEDAAFRGVKLPKRRDDTGISKSRSLKPEASHSDLLPGLGTMMQDRVDWLSEERRRTLLNGKQISCLALDLQLHDSITC